MSGRHWLDGQPGMSVVSEMQVICAISAVQDRLWSVAAMARVMGDEQELTDSGLASNGLAILIDESAQRLVEVSDALRKFLALPDSGFEDPRADELNERRREEYAASARATLSALSAAKPTRKSKRKAAAR